MLYVDFNAGNKLYKLRLNTRNTVMLEKSIGRNPLGIFTENGVERIPTITECVTVLFASLQQYNHGISMNDAYDIFDEYLDEGNSYTDFIPVILDIYKVSGILRESKATEEDNSEKN
jgi:hypothetical protein